MRYTKFPKNIRFDENILLEADKYQKKHGVDFSTLVRVALQSFLSRKLYGEREEW
jgi:antitoxin component of RelBE/YafQ-DinJ toxin-antitoxin module